MQVHKQFLYRLVTSGWRVGLILKGDRLLLVRLRYSPAVGVRRVRRAGKSRETAAYSVAEGVLA